LIVLDTNILVYARRKESAHHAVALRLLRGLAEGDAPWALPWPCVYEFLRVVTHPRVFDPPTSLEAALDDLDSLFQSPSLTLLAEGPSHPSHMIRALESGTATGNLVHDAHIAALATEHGATELWTTDGDFSRFRELPSRNPFVETRLNDPRVRYRTRR
jgi:toxin-antitoxin system PIN domain toxin